MFWHAGDQKVGTPSEPHQDLYDGRLIPFRLLYIYTAVLVVTLAIEAGLLFRCQNDGVDVGYYLVHKLF